MDYGTYCYIKFGDYKYMPTEEYYDIWRTTTEMITGSRVWSHHLFPKSRECVRSENVSEKYCDLNVYK